MKKTLYLTILTIITVFCIIIGSIMHLGLFRLSLDPFRMWADQRSAVTEEIVDEITDEVIIETTKETADAVRDAMKDISEIDIDCNVMDLNIESGKTFDISYSFSDDSLRPIISTQDGTLTITQVSSGWKHRFGHHSDDHHLFNSSAACKLTITIPAEVTLKDLSVRLSIGTADLEGVSAESCAITVNVGNVDLEDFTCTFLDVSGNSGEVECENCDIENATIDLDIGSVTYQAKNALSDCNITLVTDLGEIQALGESHGRSFSQDGAHGSLKITTNMGSITVK